MLLDQRLILRRSCPLTLFPCNVAIKCGRSEFPVIELQDKSPNRGPEGLMVMQSQSHTASNNPAFVKFVYKVLNQSIQTDAFTGHPLISLFSSFLSTGKFGSGY